MSLLLGIMLALACAVATNIGFLYKHRGACQAPDVDISRPLFTAKSLFSCRLFALGMAIATGAWLFHVAALALAPISLVQAVLAGGIVLLAVMAERSLGLTLGRRQWSGIVLTAVGLLLLGLTLPAIHGAHSSYSPAGMAGFEIVLMLGAAVLIAGPQLGVATAEHHGFMLGAAAGILFGVSDVAIKALSGIAGAHGVIGLASPWLVLAAAASIAAFFASAKGLQDGDVVPVIAVTSTAANVSGIVGGILVFGDPLPGSPLGLGAQALAFGLVIVAAWLTPVPVRAAGCAPALAVA